jgi:hypothetical protein
MAAVYSTQLISLAGLIGSHTYTNTLANQFLVVIRDLDVAVTTPAALTTFVLRGPAGQVMWVVSFPAGVNNYSQWRGRQVLNPGDTIQVQAGPDAVDVMVSGYNLSLP